MRYKIGEVAKILDIPVETIRFYESKHLITPYKDPDSGYRYYTDKDINLLLDYKRFREMGFSLNESAEIMRQRDLNSFLGTLDEKIADAERLARFYQLKTIKLRNYKNVVENIPLLIGEYQEVIRPEGIMYINRRYRDGWVDYRSAAESDGVFASMMENITFAENVYCIRQEYLENDRATVEFDVGFTMKKRWADTFKVPDSPIIEHFSAVKSLYTVLKLDNPMYYSKVIFTDVLAYMEKRRMRLSGDIIGNQVTSVTDGDTKTRYVEVWIPFEKN